MKEEDLERLPAGAHVLYTVSELRARLEQVWLAILEEHGRLARSNGMALVPILRGAVCLARDSRDILGRLERGIDVVEYPIRICRTAGERLMPPEIREAGHDPMVLRGRLAVVIDDLTDEGATLRLARNHVVRYAPGKLVTLVGFTKRGSGRADVVPDYACFELALDGVEADRNWIFGYGMDWQDGFRELDCVASVRLDADRDAQSKG